MNSLIISLSGVRGIIGRSLTPEILSKLAGAFGTILHGGRVVIATDSRISRRMCLDAVTSGLISTGCETVSLGICPTPSLQIMIPRLKARGGICITASHNPPEWNGLKFYTGEGILLDPARTRKLLSIFHQLKINYVPPEKLGTCKTDDRAPLIYKLAVLKILDVELIKKKRFRIAIDCGNGAGSIIAPVFLKELGCRVIKLNCETSGFFNRSPEPIPQNLKKLCLLVRDKKADAGFAQDADADRLAVVSDRGECLGEDYSLTLTTQFFLSHFPGPVVTNLSTTQAMDKVAEKFGCHLSRSKVGERNVIDMMKKKKAVIGGEGNGGIILPRVHYGRDSLIGMGLLLQYMAESGLHISQLAASIPQYHIIKRKVHLKNANVSRILRKIHSSLKDARFDFRDGVKAIWGDSWIHVRPSGTEPVLRLVAEAKTRSEAIRIYKKVTSIINI